MLFKPHAHINYYYDIANFKNNYQQALHNLLRKSLSNGQSDTFFKKSPKKPVWLGLLRLFQHLWQF